MAKPLWLFAPRQLALVLAGALLLCWPMLLVDGPLLFPDTRGYIRGGELTVDALLRMLSAMWSTGGAAAGGGLGAVAAQTEALRSVPWSLFSYLVFLPFGAGGIAVAQTAIVLLFLLALVPAGSVRPRDAMVAGAGLALLTPLPWYASYVMPDLLAAAAILYGVLIARGIDRLGVPDRILLGLLAAFVILSHQGYLPLAVAVLLVALGLRLVRGQGIGRGVALAALAPPALAIATMLVGSAAMLDGPSIAPRRLPILLARSIEDGPARWHLEKHCATEGYAVCEIFDTIPMSAARVLWGERGLRLSASMDQMNRIRAEEPVILWRAFAEYPLRQSWSLARNAARQLVLVGGDQIEAGVITRSPLGELEVHVDHDLGRATIDAFAVVWTVSAVAAALWIGAAALRSGLTRSEQDMVLMLAIGLLANAAIFGGLSAPADRYQARVVWLVPALAAMLWLSRRTASVGSRARWSGSEVGSEQD